MYFLYDNFVCDEINISFEEFREELKNKIYEYPTRVEKQWSIDKKINFLNFLKNGYPDMGIIVDIKKEGQRIILDGVERCKAIDELGSSFVRNINKKIRIFELRGSNRKKMDFLRYYNFNGREKSETELRRLIYEGYVEYKILEKIEQIFKVISEEVTIDFLLKLLSKITIKEILEENDLIEEYLENNMITFDTTALRSRFIYINYPIVNNFASTEIYKLLYFLLDKLNRYARNEVYEYFIDAKLKKSLEDVRYELNSILFISTNNVYECKEALDKIVEKSNKLFEILKKENRVIKLSSQSIEKDFYKYIKNDNKGNV